MLVVNRLDATSSDYLLVLMRERKYGGVLEASSPARTTAALVVELLRRRTEDRVAPRFGIYWVDLAQAGWAFVFADDAEAVSPWRGEV